MNNNYNNFKKIYRNFKDKKIIMNNQIKNMLKLINKIKMD